MKIAIHGRQFKQDTLPYILEIFSGLNQHGAEILLSREFKSQNNTGGIDLSAYQTYSGQSDLQDVKCLFSLGGDGTLLECLTHVGPLEIPMFGINTGRLGFLATIAKTEINNALNLFFSDKYTLDYRSLIHVNSIPDTYGATNYALNEFAIMKKDTSSMIVVECHIDGEYLNTYWADGLMVATPTGSTGYSLSCGGPVVMPHSNTFVITPVSPHNLNVRPVIIPDTSELSFKIESRGVNFLTSLDSRSYTVDRNVRLSIKKEVFRAVLVKLEGKSYLNTLRNKLNWGLDVRN